MLGVGLSRRWVVLVRTRAEIDHRKGSVLPTRLFVHGFVSLRRTLCLVEWDQCCALGGLRGRFHQLLLGFQTPAPTALEMPRPTPTAMATMIAPMRTLTMILFRLLILARHWHDRLLILAALALFFQ